MDKEERRLQRLSYWNSLRRLRIAKALWDQAYSNIKTTTAPKDLSIEVAFRESRRESKGFYRLSLDLQKARHTRPSPSLRPRLELIESVHEQTEWLIQDANRLDSSRLKRASQSVQDR